MAADPKKPFGNVKYADPGYQSDGVYRYPIHTAKNVRAAWSYINQRANASKYTQDQLRKVRARIMAAAKRFGITITSENYQEDILDVLNENFDGYEFSEEAQTWRPPAGVRAEGKRALDWMKDNQAGSGFTGVGRARASQLANGEPVSLTTIKRMASYLARHEVDKKGEGWSPGEPGYPSPGRVAWAAWGGDPAKGWTAKILRSVNAAQNKESVEVSEAIGNHPAPELQLIATMYQIVSKYGKLADQDGKGIWVGYKSPEDNADNIPINVRCASCSFYEGDDMCGIVDRPVHPDGLCRLAAIPDGVVKMGMEPDDDDSDDSDSDESISTEKKTELQS